MNFFQVMLLAAQISNSGQSREAVKAVGAFYSEYQELHISGLPDKQAIRKLSPYLSAELIASITRARQRQAQCISAHPGDKGPWVEGDMFSSNFEGFAKFRVGDPKPGNGQRQLMTLNFEYVDGGKSHTWADQVVVVRQGNRWVLDDILYGRKAGFGNGFGGSLRQSMKGKGC